MIKIPKKLKKIMDNDQELSIKLLSTISPFVDILETNNLCFFSEYTDHGIRHINNTLQYAENLIADDTFKYLTPEEVVVMILSVVLHDIGMHTNPEMFKNMIDGKYDNLVDMDLFPNENTWKELWNSFLYDCRYWNEDKKKNIFGEPNHQISVPNLDNLQSLTEYDKKLIGEFIRLHHCRIAYEVSQKGFIGRKTIECTGMDPDYIALAGIVARSHGMDVRDTFPYLKSLSGDENQIPFGIRAVYLMVLLRLADYLQIDNSRTSESLFTIKTLNSPYSRREHKAHLCIKNIKFSNVDKEKIDIIASPRDALTYVKIDELSDDIQSELDQSWAILGEKYPDYKYKLKYRRITTNIRSPEFINARPYVPQQFGFNYNNDLFKLLISPLYGDDPTYGVRELVQNAVDACRICTNVSSTQEPSCVIVSIDSKKSEFSIKDTGIGMNLFEIKNYFLSIGSSYNENITWKKIRDKEHLYRTGRFGIGILAAFLLGPQITVITRKRGERIGYKFTASMFDKFIQIDKGKDVECGTTIKISCDREIIKRLSKDNTWCKWYIDKSPEVRYFFDGNQKYNQNNFEFDRELKHSSTKYGTVYWEPRRITETMVNQLKWEGARKSSLCCNGFIITRDSEKKTFSLRGVDKYRYMDFPSLHITDTYNQLPLNLQRNQIDKNVKYEFEEELAKEVFIDFLCQLIALDIKSVSNFIDLINFHSNGFSVQSNYVHNHVKEEKCLIVDKSIIWRGNSLSNWIRWINDKNNNFSFIVRFGSIHGYSINTSGDFTRNLRNFVNKTCEYILGKSLNWWEEESLSNTSRDVFKFDVIEKKEIMEPKTCLDDLFDEYLSKDPIIPYYWKDRQKKYPKLFRDYSSQIEYYRNNPSDTGRWGG